MASPSEPCAAPEKRVAPALAMPDDAVFEILLRLPHREVRRLRVVCRPWRSLLSDPHFIAAHAARHPLIVAGHHSTARRGHGSLCDVVDVLSGHVVRRVRPTWDTNELVVSTHQDLVCTLRRRTWSFRLINPATGAVHDLPDELSEENQDEYLCNFRPMVVLGKVASTGKYKVLRVLDDLLLPDQLCEVFTLDDSIDAQWRGKEDLPPDCLDLQSRVVVDGIVYLFTREAGPDKRKKRVASFDLETEAWRATIQGPVISPVGDAIGTSSSHVNHDDLSLTSLKGSLVVVHLSSSSMDLWFLIDFEKSLWVKQYSIQVNLSPQHDEFHVRPLMVLDDGRIATYIGPRGLLRIYNPRTNMYTDVTEMGPRVGIGVYTGNLLSLANGAS
ncbi:hypothetical protein ACP4OV_024504 [Aristida adscensionis]